MSRVVTLTDLQAREQIPKPQPHVSKIAAADAMVSFDYLKGLPQNQRQQALQQSPALCQALCVTKHVNAEMKQKYEHQKAHDPELLAKKKQQEIKKKEEKRSYNNRIKEKGRLESDIYNEMKHSARDRVVEYLRENNTPVEINSGPIDLTAPRPDMRLQQSVLELYRQRKLGSLLSISAHHQMLIRIEEMYNYYSKYTQMNMENEWTELLAHMDIEMTAATYKNHRPLIEFINNYPRIRFIDATTGDLVKIKARLEKYIKSNPKEAEFWSMSDYSRFPVCSVMLGGRPIEFKIPPPVPTAPISNPTVVSQFNEEVQHINHAVHEVVDTSQRLSNFANIASELEEMDTDGEYFDADNEDSDEDDLV